MAYVMKHPDWGAKEWIEYYDCLNSETPVDKLRLELDDDGKKEYVDSLEYLKKLRKKHPEVSYEVKYSWFE